MHVLTCGTFDLFHPGHLFLLRECRKLTTLTSIQSTDGTNAGAVIVGLNPDDFAASFKPRPVMSYPEREAMLRACSYVDEVVENVHGNTQALLEQYKPGFLVIGQDWACRDYYTQIGVTQQELDEMGVSLLYVPRPDGTISSTEIKARIGLEVRMKLEAAVEPEPWSAEWYEADPRRRGLLSPDEETARMPDWHNGAMAGSPDRPRQGLETAPVAPRSAP